MPGVATVHRKHTDVASWVRQFARGSQLLNPALVDCLLVQMGLLHGVVFTLQLLGELDRAVRIDSNASLCRSSDSGSWSFSTLARLARMLILLLLWHIGRENLLVKEKIGAPFLLRTRCDDLIQATEHVTELKVGTCIIKMRDLSLGQLWTPLHF